MSQIAGDVLAFVAKWSLPILGTVLLFGLSIFVHELGHFLVALRNRMKIERFSIGFGKTIWRKVVDGIEYRAGIIPAGGYVMLPQMDPTPLEGGAAAAEDLPPVPSWVKIRVALAGAAFNVLFALVLTTLVWIFGKPIDASQRTTVIGYIDPDSVAEEAGLRLGDRILRVSGRPVEDFDDLTHQIALSPSEDVVLEIEREGELVAVPVRLKVHPEYKLRYLGVVGAATPVVAELMPDFPAIAAGVEPGDRILEAEGQRIYSTLQFMDMVESSDGQPVRIVCERDGVPHEISVPVKYDEERERYLVGARFAEAKVLVHPTPLAQIADFVTIMRDTLAALFTKGSAVGVKDLSGPVGIFNVGLRMFLQDIRLALWFMAFLNINLAILNLLPIPVLDGGHILFALWQIVTGSPIPGRLVQALHTAFVILLLSLLAYVTFHDMLRLHDQRALERDRDATEGSREPGRGKRAAPPAPAEAGAVQGEADTVPAPAAP